MSKYISSEGIELKSESGKLFSVEPIPDKGMVWLNVGGQSYWLTPQVAHGLACRLTEIAFEVTHETEVPE